MGVDHFEIVREYWALGHHRTGTDVDHATVGWTAERLTDLGLDVSIDWFEFDRFTYESFLTVDGEAVEHLPVFYEWTGDLSADSVHVTSVDPKSGGVPGVLVDAVGEAQDIGQPALVATQHPLGSLVAVNRPERTGSGHPTVLVAGRDLDRLEQGSVELDLHARIEPGRTANVVASTGDAHDPLMLTTPLNGWFG